MISAALGLDISQFSAKIGEAKNKMSGLGAAGGGMTGLGTVFAAAAAGIAAAAAAAGAAAVGMWNAMDAGGRMVDLQEQTGIGIETLLKLETAFVKIGMSAGDVGTVINKLQKSIAGAASEGGAALGSINELGLSIGDLTAMRPEAQLKAVGDAIAQIEDPAKKAQLAMELFGKSGGRLLPLLAAGGLDQVAKQLGNQARLMAENAGVFDRVTDVLETAGAKVQGFFVGMASAIAPQLLAAVDAFEGIDLSGLGQQVGQILATLIQAFRSGEVWTAVGQSLAASFQFAVNVFATLMSATLSGIGLALVQIFRVFTTAQFWGGLLMVMQGIADVFGARLLKFIPGMKSAASDLEKTGQAILGAGTSATTGAVNVKELVSGAFGSEGVQQSFAAIKQDAQQLGQTLGEAFAPFSARASAVADIARNITNKAPTPGGVAGEAFAGGLGGGRPEPIVSSLARLGGAFTGTFGAADPQLDQMRQQTTTLQGMLGKLDQLIANTAPSNSISGGLNVATLA